MNQPVQLNKRMQRLHAERAYAASVAELDLTGLSERDRAIILRGVRGGDGDETPTLTELLDEVGKVDELDDEGVQTLIDDLRTAGLALAEDPTDENLELGDKVIEAVSALEAVQTTRTEEAEARQTRAAELRDKLSAPPEGGDGEDDAADDGSDDDAGDDADDDSDGSDDAGADDAGDDSASDDAATGEDDLDDQADDDADKVAAAARAKAAKTKRQPRKTSAARTNARRPAGMRGARPRATASSGRGLKLVASANLSDTPAGAILDNPDKIAAAFGEAIERGRGYRGGREKVRVASCGSFDAADEYGEDRTLRWDARENDRRINALTSPEAIKASGGICAPPENDYSVPVMGDDSRPFWDEMAVRMGADRGGVNVFPAPLLSDVEDGIGVWTEPNDVSPSDPTTKPCVRMTCPEPVVTTVEALTRCMEVGNFRQRFWAEQVEAWLQKMAIQAARHAETRHLTQLGDLATNVTVDHHLGTTRDVLAGVDLAAAGQRSFFRFPKDMPMHLGLPDWLYDNMITDLSREQPGSTDERLAMSEAKITGFFGARNINVTLLLDGESGQIFGAQGDGALNRWPSEAIGYLYPEGLIKGLDGGSIDFGTVRDSTLNSTNDLQIFAEVFQAVLIHGDGQLLRMQFEICANGATSAAIDLDLCSTGS